MNRHRWLLYGGLIGMFIWLAPNFEMTHPQWGREWTVRVGMVPWFQYQHREEHRKEGGKEIHRLETHSHVSLINPSVAAGVVGLGLLIVYRQRVRREAAPVAESQAGG